MKVFNNRDINGTKYGYGIKCLDPTGCTEFTKPFVYNLPHRGDRWARTAHPLPDKPDVYECGSGRLHIHRSLSSANAPKAFWFWFARYKVADIVGQGEDKLGVTSLELRRIHPDVLARALRPPFNWGRDAMLAGLTLYCADLTDADLQGANLCGAGMRRTCFRGANLRFANLSHANLKYTNFHWASLHEADLRGADLTGAYIPDDVISEAKIDDSTILPDALAPSWSYR